MLHIGRPRRSCSLIAAAGLPAAATASIGLVVVAFPSHGWLLGRFLMRHPLLLLSCFAALGLTPTNSGADLFKCVGVDGKVAYQAEPCAAAAQEKRIRTTAEAGEIGPNGVELL